MPCTRGLAAASSYPPADISPHPATCTLPVFMLCATSSTATNIIHVHVAGEQKRSKRQPPDIIQDLDINLGNCKAALPASDYGRLRPACLMGADLKDVIVHSGDHSPSQDSRLGACLDQRMRSDVLSRSPM